MIFKRGHSEEDSSPIFIVDAISEHRTWSRASGEGTDYVAPLYVYDDTENSGVVFERSVTEDVFVVDSVPEHAILGTAGYAGQFAPLFIKPLKQDRKANFDQTKLEELFSEVEQPDERSRKVYPEDLLDYVYASLHSPSYREKYKEFLKIDFPRVPRPTSWPEFWRLVDLGRELRSIHLMKSDIKIITSYHGEGADIVEKIIRIDQKVYINPDKYFDNINDTAWNFFIGGYQPAQRWLKDRKGKTLSVKDLFHYQKIISTLTETDRIMKQIG